MFGTMFGTVLFFVVYGLSTVFLLCVLVKFFMESREKKNQEKFLHAVTADKWSRYRTGWSGW